MTSPQTNQTGQTNQSTQTNQTGQIPSAADINPPWWNRWARPVIGGGRIVGVDVARAIALVGMVAVHIDQSTFLGLDSTSWRAGDLPFAYRHLAGTASALFCFLAGVAIAISSGCLGNKPARSGSIGQLLGRAFVVGYLGWLITTDETRIAVILIYYSVMMLFMAPLVRLSGKVLLPLAGLWLVLAPIISMYVRQVGPAKELGQIGLTISNPIDHTLWNLVFTGYYPAFTWSAFMLLGLAVGKLDLRSPRVHYILAGVGALGTAIGQALYLSMSPNTVPSTFDRQTRNPMEYGHWWTGHYGVSPYGWDWQWLPIPHTASIADLAHNSCKALLILAIALSVERLLGKRRWLLLPLSAAGAMTLTWYCVHVWLFRHEYLHQWVDQAVFYLVASTLYVVLLRTRGPLEGVAWVGARLGKQVSLRTRQGLNALASGKGPNAPASGNPDPRALPTRPSSTDKAERSGNDTDSSQVLGRDK